MELLQLLLFSSFSFFCDVAEVRPGHIPGLRSPEGFSGALGSCSSCASVGSIKHTLFLISKSKNLKTAPHEGRLRALQNIFSSGRLELIRTSQPAPSTAGSNGCVALKGWTGKLSLKKNTMLFAC